jgi:hypothetical protein
MLFSCQLLEPDNENYSTFDRVYEDPAFAEGLLIRGFIQVPVRDYRYDERATDDAVTNDLANDYVRMATGGWSSQYNPQHVWQNCNDGIMYVNKFLEIVDKVPFRPSNPDIDRMYKRRYKGEAYAIRGILKYYLLRNHGGYGANGELLGTPIYDEFMEYTDKSKFSQPRAKFVDCVQTVYDDLDMAVSLLPLDFGNVTAGIGIPPGYNESGNATIDDYNLVCGRTASERVSGRIALAFKAKMALLHASPAFNEGNSALWEKAAEFSGELLSKPNVIYSSAFQGGLDIDPNGHRFYASTEVAKYNWNTPVTGKEYVWRKNRENNNTKETEHYPPTFGGNGRINPSQNFVDAFPMANGYPITADPSLSGYDPAAPYTGRDSRLGLFVLYNGASFKSNTVYTAIDGTGTHAGDNRLGMAARSTRTGYYLKKLLVDNNVTWNGSSWNTADHIEGYVRYTEMFLTYAEAANQAWGPDGVSQSYNYSARQIIGEIRKRANPGIGADPYLASLDKEGMITLIQNERRIELSFESHRFWDLRRWNKTDLMKESVRGVRWEGGIPSYFDVESRDYEDYMIYGPVPQTEILKFNFIQNRGW